MRSRNNVYELTLVQQLEFSPLFSN